MVQGVILRADGSYSEMEDISLASLQQAVGGYVTAVHSAQFKCDVWCNDDGFGERLPMNMSVALVFGFQLVGDCVVTGGVDAHGNTLPINQRLLSLLQRLFKGEVRHG